MALCSDLLVIASDAKIGYPPARVWGSPTTALWAARIGPMRAKRLLLTGDSLTGEQAAEWGLATEAAPPGELDERFEAPARARRAAADQPAGDDEDARQPVPLRPGPAPDPAARAPSSTAIARHTEEGHDFVRRAAEGGFREAVRERDEPFGDHGLEGFGVE